MTVKPIKLLDAKDGRPRLDRYELVAELAAGGMATVFLARIGGAGGFQRFVAIKRLHPHLAHEQDFVEMFLDEARLAASIHHPNVVPILEVGESDLGYYLVMEYIEGDTLWHLRVRASKEPERRIEMPVTLRVMLDALAGLHAAHELVDENGQPVSLVHRDISPQNIMVGVDGTSRITDFGVARAATRLSSTRSGELKGKLAYMAPEQVLGAPIDRRADVFAMGIVLWEILGNRHLFRGEHDAVTINRVLNEPIPDVRSANPAVPAAIAEVLTRALERDQSKRLATAADFAEALEAAARAGGVTVASGRDVAVYVERLLGPGLSERRVAVRGWLDASDPGISEVGSIRSRVTRGPLSSPASIVSGVTEGPQTTSLRAPDAPDAPARSRRAVWIAAPLVLLAVGGLLGVAVRSRSTPAAAATPLASASSSSGSKAPALDEPASASAIVAAPPASVSATVAEPPPKVVTAPGRGRPTPRQTATSTARSNTPDDMAQNPYLR